MNRFVHGRLQIERTVPNAVTQAVRKSCSLAVEIDEGESDDRAVQIFGGAGYMSDYGIERFYRDVRLFRIYEGTTQIQQILIARNMVKAAA